MTHIPHQDRGSTGRNPGDPRRRRGLARFVCGRRTKWVTLALWLVVIVALAPLASKLTGAQDNDAQSWLPGSAESTKVLDASKDFRDERTPAVVIYAREDGLTRADQRRVSRAAEGIKELRAHGIRGWESTGPVYDRRENPRAAQILVPITMDEDGWERIAPAVDRIREVSGTSAGGLSVHITGPGGTSADFAEAFEGIDSTLLYAAASVVIIALLVTYRSPTLLLVPLFSVIAALLTAQAIVYLLAEHAGLTVNGQSAGILLVLVFGAGTDYALLLVARYREELRRHHDRHEAMAVAVHRAGPAVLASGATVVISLLVLVFAEMNSTSGLGPVCAVGVTLSLLAMLTLFPALLVIVGRWIFWPLIPHEGSREPTEHGMWARIGARISHRPRAVWSVTAIVLAALSLGILQLRAAGLANEDAFTDTPDSVTGQQISARYFPAGSGDPLVIVTDTDRAPAVKRVVAGTEGVVPDSLAVPPGTRRSYEGRTLFEATMTDPPDSAAAKKTVDRVRDAVDAVPGAETLVGGGTAALLDADDASVRDNKLVMPLVLVVVLLVLTVLLRALVAPLLLIATVVLSYAAALGISALAFRHLFDYAGEETSYPLFVFVFLVALGIDYNIFLATRIREEARRQGTRPGTRTALAATGAVITSAGLVLAGTFAVLGTLPVTAFAEIGFAVAVGVLLDTFIVRSVLVTSLFLDIGPKIWWPHQLHRQHAERPPTQGALH